MSRSRAGVCSIVIIVSMMAAACGEPPEKEMQQAEGARIAPAKIAGPRAALADGDHALQEARAAVGRGEYTAATDAMTAATPRLRAAARDLEAMVASAPHRRR